MADNGIPEGFELAEDQPFTHIPGEDAPMPKAGDPDYDSGQATPIGSPVDLIAGGIGSSIGKGLAEGAGAVLGNEVGAIGADVAAPGVLQKVTTTLGINESATPQEAISLINKGFDSGLITQNEANRAIAALQNKIQARAGRVGYADGGVISSVPEGFELAPENQSTVVNQAPAQTDGIPEGFELEEDKFGTPGQQLMTAAEGAAQGLVGPLAPYAETKLGLTTPEEIRGREEANPWTHGLSEAAGLVGGAVAGTGVGGALGKVGEAVGAIGPAGKVANAALRGAAENAVFQGLDEVSKTIKENPEQSVQTAIANIGMAAVIGGGLSGAFGAVPDLWKAQVGGKVGQLVSDFQGRWKFNVENPDAAAAMTDELTQLHGVTSNLADEVYGPNGIKSKAIQAAVPEMHEGIAEQVQGFSDKIQKNIEKMKADQYSYPPRLATKLENDYNAYLNTVTRPGATPGEIFDATQDLKQVAQSYAKYDKFVKPTDEAYDFVRDTKSLAHDLRTGLEDREVWGKAADLQQKINKGFSEYLPTLKDFQKKFMTEVNGERVIDSTKINTYLNQVGKPNAEIKQQVLENFLDASDRYRKIIGDAHRSVGAEAPELATPLSVTRSTLGEKTPGAKLADYVYKQGAAKVAGQALGAGIGSGVGHAVGAGGIGALVGSHALGPFFSSVLPAITEGLSRRAVNSSAAKSAVDFAMAVAKGESALNRAVGHVFDVSEKELPSHLTSPGEDARAKLDKRLIALQTDQKPLMAVGGHLGHYMPDHAGGLSSTIANNVTYLNSIRPNQAPKAPLDGKLPVPAAKQAAYNRALDIAQKPLTVLGAVKTGRLTSQDVQTFKTLYPALYARTTQKLFDQMTEAKAKGAIIPYQTRIALSRFMGQPLDSSLIPQAVLAAQPTPQMAQPQTATQPASKPKRSVSALDKLPGEYETTSQARNSRANKK